MKKENWLQVEEQLKALITDAERTIEINTLFLKEVQCKIKKL